MGYTAGPPEEPRGLRFDGFGPYITRATPAVNVREAPVLAGFERDPRAQVLDAICGAANALGMLAWLLDKDSDSAFQAGRVQLALCTLADAQLPAGQRELARALLNAGWEHSAADLQTVAAAAHLP